MSADERIDAAAAAVAGMREQVQNMRALAENAIHAGDMDALVSATRGLLQMADMLLDTAAQAAAALIVTGSDE